ncbi:RebB family R body protein [Desulfovibrio ferrophilus]|uniref:RebB protein n=1 Tax=Desulfovibrio ferrophilus TaxID=241368 RepID=A0A2Z6B3N4_9BACT|nr:RebB family R body protein [Desulfovibrio ferrophilus]BBD10073.1 RebB protein [Desulfovibrio ferrophilus]
MAYPTSMNSQVTDAVTQANVKVLGDSPAMALGNLFIVTSQALGNAAHNATTAQQQTNVTAQASMTEGIAMLLSVDTAATGKATQKIFA